MIRRIARLIKLLGKDGSRGRSFRFRRKALPLEESDRNIARLLNLREYTKTSQTPYSAKSYDAGYHTLSLNGVVISGQRDPALRLQNVPFEFSGKTVLDIGCNQGGMLHCFEGQLKKGIGIDFDYRQINAANLLNELRGDASLQFYVFDLERDPLDLIEDFLPGPRVDIVFLLSVCMWISNWRDVIKKCAELSDALLFESNGSKEQQKQQIQCLHKTYPSVSLLADSSEDDPNKKARKLYLCRM